MALIFQTAQLRETVRGMTTDFLVRLIANRGHALKWYHESPTLPTTNAVRWLGIVRAELRRRGVPTKAAG
jgi:hypothetical protein